MTFEDKVGAVLIIGGGIAGIQSSLDLANLGFKVYLVEKNPSIGGRMAQLDKTFPTNDCSLCILAPKMVDVFRHPNIELLTYSEVIGLEGEAGNFSVKVLRKARYVEEDTCTGCGDCTTKCPKRGKIPDEFDAGLGKRGAIYIAFPQAVPPVAVIDSSECLYFKTGKCRLCEKVCKSNSINFDMKDKEVILNVGAIILATGFEEIDPSTCTQYGYLYDNVLTGLEYERLMCASGPTNGSIQRISDGKHPHKIAFLSCVGSRNTVKGKGVSYCSSVCCMYIAKECIITKEHAPDTECIVFKSDVRSYGKGFNEFVQRAENEYDVKYITGRVSFIEEDPITKNLILYYEDMDAHESVRLEVDLVVLAVGLRPSGSIVKLAEILDVDIDEFGFVNEKSVLNPVRTSHKGIFVCGYSQIPKDIPESVADASGTAGKVSELLTSVRGTLVEKGTIIIPEKDIKVDDDARIGVMVCHCGTNIGGVVSVDEVVEYAKTLPNVVHVEGNLYSCSSDSQERVKELITKYDLNRFVVAACTPRTHEKLFAETCKEGGLNPYLFQFVNIRDQCSWVHMSEKEAATQKSKDLIRMNVGKARLLQPLKPGIGKVTQRALVIGGGISGLTASLSIAKAGYPVILISDEEKLGGMLNKLNILYPTGEKARDIIEPVIEKVKKHKNIEIFTSSTLKSLSGYVGKYEFDISTNNEVVSRESGVIIVATGAKELKPEFAGYNERENVITQLDLEKILSEDSLDKNTKDVVMMLCTGSREKEGKFTYCSKYCCSSAIKNALILKEKYPNIDVTILYRDIQMAGKGEENYYRLSREKIKYTRYSLDKLPIITDKTDNSLNIHVENQLNHEILDINCDLFVLTPPLVPQDNTEELAQQLKVPTMRDVPPFFLEAHVKLRPLDFATAGIFVCGTALWPKSTQESVSQAFGAAARAKIIISKKTIETEVIVSNVDVEKCVGCGLCAEVCPYNAIRLETVGDTLKAHTLEVSCMGCGVCGATCPMNAITMHHFTDEQIISQIEKLHEG